MSHKNDVVSALSMTVGGEIFSDRNSVLSVARSEKNRLSLSPDHPMKTV